LPQPGLHFFGGQPVLAGGLGQEGGAQGRIGRRIGRRGGLGGRWRGRHAGQQQQGRGEQSETDTGHGVCTGGNGANLPRRQAPAAGVQPTNLRCAYTGMTTPKPASRVTADVPPKLSRGMGTPTTGNRPATMPPLTITYTEKASASEPANRRE